MKTTHLYLIIAAGVALEWANSRVTSGASAADGNTMASIEGQLANLDQVTGSTLRLGLVLIVFAVFWLFYR
jgi:hypothetical protein